MVEKYKKFFANNYKKNLKNKAENYITIRKQIKKYCVKFSSKLIHYFCFY